MIQWWSKFGVIVSRARGLVGVIRSKGGPGSRLLGPMCSYLVGVIESQGFRVGGLTILIIYYVYDVCRAWLLASERAREETTVFSKHGTQQ